MKLNIGWSCSTSRIAATLTKIIKTTKIVAEK